ncbi:MAG: hypothetical protein LBQ52_09510 [Helicobacteraceae bacterium]|jgi:hypothetical protein|nr:hypothetical protein [Helicobacteraceae bacterium]
MRLKSVAAVLALLLGAEALAVEVLVTPVDRDRLIRMKDGRQLRLPAGSELIKTDDGRFATRRAIKEQAAQETPKQVGSGDRWVWFAGADVAMGSISRDYTVKTNKHDANVSFQGEVFPTDGGSHSFSKDETATAFGIVGGIKDEQEQNYYQLGYYIGDDINELTLSAQFGFPSAAFLDGAIVPYARVILAAGFEDGIGSPDSFAFGGGIGATYLFSPKVEFYGGLDYLMRNFESKTGEATLPSSGATIDFGKIEQEEKETRFYVGVRYLFR